MLEIPDIFLGVKGRCWAKAYVQRKNETTFPEGAIMLHSMAGAIMALLIVYIYIVTKSVRPYLVCNLCTLKLQSVLIDSRMSQQDTSQAQLTAQDSSGPLGIHMHHHSATATLSLKHSYSKSQRYISDVD